MDNITIKQALQEGIKQLEQAKIQSDTLKLDCEILLLTALNQTPAQTTAPEKTKTWLLTWPEHLLTDDQSKQYRHYLQQRATGKPVAYITGEKDFWSFRLKVTPDTLIPRPETELLVECALQKIPLTKPSEILDLGTGSGAIALAIASERPAACVLASDFSQAALDIAMDNARQLNINNIQFCQSDWFSTIAAQVPEHGFDIIASNPPYITHNDPQLEEPVRLFEPESALLSEQNGLQDIIQIIQGCGTFLTPNGWLMLEHGYTQGKVIQTLLNQYGARNISTIDDLNGLQRVTMGQFNYGHLSAGF